MKIKRNAGKMIVMTLTLTLLFGNGVYVGAETISDDYDADDPESYVQMLAEAESYVDESKKYAQDRVLVFMEPDGADELKNCAESISDNSVSRLLCEMDDTDEFCFTTVELEDDISVSEAVSYYSSLPGVAYVQPDYKYDLDELLVENADSYYNDIYSGYQWYLDTLHVENALNLLRGQSLQKVRVAIIDTGIDLSHPDLQKNINSSLCVSSVDDSFTQISTDLGSSGHGTHIAGIIGATANNGIGTAGIADGCVEIMAIRCQDESGGIYSSYAVRGIEYAVSNGARLINISLGMTKTDSAMELALQYAYDSGVLTVCSAGNAGSNEKHYPSAYSSTIGIINVTKEKEKNSNSNYGTDNFISAPGTMIYSTLPDGKYGYKSGTSMAAGVATGTIALLLSVNPTLTNEQLKNIMSQTAADIYSPGFDEYSGWGIIDAEAMIAVEACDNAKTTYGFVTRLYQLVLGRMPDIEGRDYYINLLNTGKRTGAEVAIDFIGSKEFVNQNITDPQYIDILYRTFMGREPDAEGKQYWISFLENGMSRFYVADCFCGSAEFQAICHGCGIESGRINLTENRDRNEGLTGLIARQYTKALGRSFDVEGLNYWTGVILNGEFAVLDVVTTGFFHSKEFQNKQLSDKEFVDVLYQTFFDREYDAEGMQYWLNEMQQKRMTRDQVLYYFANSKEFQTIRTKYGF